MNVLENIQGFVHRALVDELQQGRSPSLPLRRVRMTRLVDQPMTSVSFEFDRHSWNHPIRETRETEWQLHCCMSTTLLAQIFRYEFYAVHGIWESYIPSVEPYHYAVHRRLRSLSPGTVRADDTFTTTRDPLMARDPDGEQLRQDLAEARHHCHVMADYHQMGIGNPVETVQRAERIVAMESFRPANMDRIEPMLLIRQYRPPLPPPPGPEEEVMRAAEAKGWELLKSNLSEKQRAMLEEKKYFEVIGCDTGRLYRIYTGRSYNIHLMNRTQDVWEDKLCFQPVGYLVTGDVMLTQKLALELRENEALAVANRFHIPPQQQRQRFTAAARAEARSYVRARSRNPLFLGWPI